MLVLPLGGDDTRAMLDGLAHDRPLVNGDSGFIPRPFDRALELFAYGLSDEGLRFLRSVGVRHVVAPTEVTPEVVPGVTWPEGTHEVARFATERVAEVEAGEGAHVVEPGEPVATRFTEDAIVLALPEARTIGRVAFELSDAEWVALPRVEASLDGVAWEPVVLTRASLSDATLSLYRDPTHGRGEIRFTPRPVRLPAPRPAPAGSRGAGRSRPIGARAARPRPANRAVTWRSRRERHPDSRHTVREPVA